MTNEQMILKIKETDDRELFNEFFNKNVGLIGTVFEKWKMSIHFRHDHDDLYGLLNMVFFESFNSFDPNRDVKFSTWFFVQANGRIRSFIRDHPRLESHGFTLKSFDANLRDGAESTLYDVLNIQDGLNVQDQVIENEEKREDAKYEKYMVKKNKKSNVTDKDREVLSKIKEMIATNAPFILTINGIAKPIEEWSAESGVAVNTIRMRLRKGWSYDRLLTPPQTGKPRTRKK